MKYNGLLVSLGIAAALMSGSTLANTGKINFKGSIVNSPCSIDAGTADQTINFGQVSSVTLKSQGKSQEIPLKIELKNCEITPTNDSVTATFSGATSATTTGNLALTGTASGASIAIFDGNKKVAIGTATDAHVVINGNNTLEFRTFLQSDGASAVITPGDFSAIANFTLAYN